MKKTLITLAAILCVVAQTQAADLTKIDRTIAKEPTYETNPKYCLLVFGKEAAHRVWLVWDGDYLYVDKNGNGDLTELGERIPKKTGDDAFFQENNYFSFEIEELRVGKQVHKQLSVSVSDIAPLADRLPIVKSFLKENPKAKRYSISIELDMPGLKGTGIDGRVQHLPFVYDLNGIMQFASTSADAPIMHFGGPLQITMFGHHQFTIDRQNEMILAVGTPGYGPGTTTYIGYEGVIPVSANPKVEIVYPAKEGSPPVRELYELKQRC